MIISNNLIADNANRMYKLNTGNKVKSTKKLSSGYRINSASDDAAGLAISEKMREQIRGLNKGTQNAQDGISWTQTGDGALNEVHDILHRMSELTVQSLNDTNTQEDRMALQAEFDALQSEVDRICGTTQFNTKNIFSAHEPEFHQLEGNRFWEQGARHMVTVPDNTLEVTYKLNDTDPAKTVVLEVEEGVYTTQELIDELDDALNATGAADDGLRFEFTKDGTCNLTIEGGKAIESMEGGLSYLVYDMYNGGSVGALIGTTLFRTEAHELEIVRGKNDNMSFQIQDFDGNVKTMDMTIAEGKYTRQQLIDMLNQKLQGTSVEAVAYGTGIKMQSDEAIITGFKGNMFKMESEGKKYTSVFYDNIMYGDTSLTPARFLGGNVINMDSRDEKNDHYTIDSSNNILTLSLNGGSKVDIEIDKGEYTVPEMAEKLNELFKKKGLDLTAASYTKAGFQGIELVSGLKGLNSSIELDDTSSAYNTLFVGADYTTFSLDASVFYDNKSDKVPEFVGGKSFTSSELPLKIESGKNDKFTLNIGSDKYEIKLKAGTYSTQDALLKEINSKLNGSSAGSGYKGKIEVSWSQNRLLLKGAKGSGLTEINISAVSGNDGYKDLFVGENIRYNTIKVSNKGTSTTPAKITTNTVIEDGKKIDDTSFVININGQNQTITVPAGTYTRNELLEKINKQLKEEVVTYDNTFTKIDAYGDSSNVSTSLNGKGTTKTTVNTYSGKGESSESEGEAGVYDVNTPAKVTVNAKLSSNTVIDDMNNTFSIKINGVDRTLTLDEGTYSQSELAQMIQKKVDSAYGKYYGGAEVSVSKGNLVFTARLNNASGVPQDGATTKIELTSNGGTFMKELHTTRTAATGISSRDIQSSVDITNDNNEFKFSYTDKNGNQKDVNLKLSNGTYTRTGFVSEINKQLKKEGVSVTASLSGNKLQLKTDDEGENCRISYSNASGGSSSEAIFGNSISETAAVAVANCDVQNSIEIDSTSNKFNINIDGKDYSVTLDNGTYTKNQIAGELNKKLRAAGAGVTVTLEGNKLKYTTDKKGKQASIHLEYGTGGSAMKKIYGESTVKKYGATASFTSDGKLQITGKDKNGSLSMSSDNGGIFLKSTSTSTDINPTIEKGYISSYKSYIDGVNLTSPVTIDKYNKKLNFTYSKNGSNIAIAIELDEKTYTFDELKDALQKKLDKAAGKDQLSVSVDGNGVRIECVNAGNAYKMEKSSFSGNFYYNVLCTSTERHNDRTVKNNDGTQNVNQAYAVGRHDVKTQSVEIETDVNDELTLDFKYGNDTKTFTMKLDAGKYRGDKLVDEIQKKLNEQLKAEGFEENLIEVGIGKVSTGVIGSNDDKSLCFMLSKKVPVPNEGEYIIDGIRGNAAFYVFYESDGKMEAAYTKGSKDITEGVEITDENNTLNFDVDDVQYTITLDEGEYDAKELVDHINAKLNQANVPVKAKQDGNNLKLTYAKLGKHTLDNVTGSARNTLFYQENNGDGKAQDIKLQLSGNAGNVTNGLDDRDVAVGRDYMSIERRVVNTVSLGINSIGISRPKYAEKALERLRSALDSVSRVRSELGAEQNRLEHAINVNNNTSENTQSSESKIRDTDMAEQMVEFSKHSILQNAAQAMISQANSIPEGVLKLLQ